MEKKDAQTTVPLLAEENPVTKEVFGTEANKDTFKVSANPKPSTPAPPVIEEEDDLTASVPSGATCRRNGCKVVFVSDGESRMGDGETSICTYHPAAVRSLCCVGCLLWYSIKHSTLTAYFS